MKVELTEVDNSRINFLQVIPNSQMYTDLKHIENSLEFGGETIDREHMLIGVKNTIKAGYKIVPPEPELKIDDVVLYKTDNSKGIPIVGKIVNIKMDGDIKIYVIKNVNALKGGDMLSTPNRKKLVKWDNTIE